MSGWSVAASESTIDLFGTGFVLLAAEKGDAWISAATGLASDGAELVAHMVGGRGDLADPEGTWRSVYGLEPDGAVLVRPDGYVGWRSRGAEADANRVVKDALDRILDRKSPYPRERFVQSGARMR